MARRVLRNGQRIQAATRYFDRQGRPIAKSVWQHLSRTHAYTHLAMDVVGGAADGSVAHVYTFWLGIAEGHRQVTFRTVLARHRLACLMWGWASEPEAYDGHRAVCAWLAGQEPMPYGLLPGLDTPPAREERDADTSA